MQSIQALLRNLINRRQAPQDILKRKLHFKGRVELIVYAKKSTADI